jgi:hypothetical protein
VPGDAAVAADYVYEIVDNTGAPLGGQFPLAVSPFTDVLSQVGRLDATIPRTHPLADRGYLDPPGREIVVSRNGQVVWNGPITYLRRSRRENTVTLVAQQLTWYLYNATLETDYSATDADLFDIVRDLVAIATGKTNGSRFAFSVSSGSAGVTKTVDYKGDYRYRIGQLIEDLASDPTGGFDFRLVVDGTGARDLTRVLQLGAPSLGTVVQGWKLQPGGGLQDLVEELNLDQSGNRVHVLPGIGATLSADNTGSLGAGDPMIEYVLNRPDLDSAKAPSAGVLAELRRTAQPPVPLYTAAYIPRADLPYGWCAPGDTVAFADPDTGLDTTGRVARIKTVPASATQDELVTLTIGQPITDLGT